MREAFAYVDPGTGFVFLQGTSFLWGIILGLLALFLLPLKFFFRSIKKFLWIFLIFVIILIITGIIIGVIMNKNTDKKKLVILGIDAMDFNITQQLMNGGKLPNLSYLKKEGSFSALKTTNPSESVVAWASFMTGLNPGGHGVFDFVMRDPKTYLPYLSLNEITSAGSKPKIQLRRKGDTFWNILSKNKVPSYIYFCPNTFPPESLFGRMLSGMGVTDILGLIGKFSFYTTKALSPEDKDSRGRIIQVTVDKNIIQTQVYGPKVNLKGSINESRVPLKIILKPEEEKISIEFQNNHFFLKKGVWSDWQRVSFKIGFLKKIHGIVRFYLKSIAPDFELYCSPINFNPQRPPFSISYPEDLSKKIANKLGLFYTQGMPHDTWALTENRIDEKAFLEHADIILEEKRKILEEGLKEFKRGVFFFYIDTLDPIQHMFWRYIDPKHPLYEPNSPYKDTIFKYYEKMDKILGEVLKNIDSDTTLIVLSDHGFASFRQAVHLNRWLLENGFLTLKEGREEGREFFEDIDWSKTKAYALGFGGIYLNRIGREKYGIVDDAEVEELKKEIQEKLRQWQDSVVGENIIKEVYLTEEIFNGSYMKDAPDLFVGFNSGYRASWQTALGGIPKTLIEDSKKKWSGDHLIDPNLVPGVIFVTKKVELEEPQIIDIAPAILGFFGIAKPEVIQGEELF